MEIWKDIKGYEGLYQISSLGRVKSLKFGKDKILKPTHTYNKYMRVDLCHHNKVKKHKVHRLVAEAFIPNPEGKSEVNHINTIQTDNRVENLEWCTHKENMNNPLTKEKQSKRFKGKQGFGLPHSKPIVQLTKQGELVAFWLTAMDAVRDCGYTQTHISNCCKGKLKTTGGYKWMYLDDFLADWWEQEMGKGVA